MMKFLPLLFCLLSAALFAQSPCSDGSPPELLTINLTGESSIDGVDDVDNTTLSQSFSGAKDVVGVDFANISLSTVGASWCSEAVIGFDGEISLTPSLQGSPGPCADLPFNAFFNLGDLGLIYTSAGTVNVQLFESFSDNANSADANYTSGTITVFGCPVGTTLLPVDLMRFTAAPSGKTISLEWATASESGNEGFAVERSEDGSDWQQIGSISGAGDSQVEQAYGFFDEEVAPATTYLYRLRQNDFDGSFEYSEVVSATVELSGNAIAGDVFPNPARAGQTVNLPLVASTDTEVTFSLVSVAGRRLQPFKLQLTEGTNRVELPTANLAAGAYLLSFELDGQSVVRKLMVGK